MSHRISCPGCRTTYVLKNPLAKAVACKKCGAAIEPDDAGPVEHATAQAVAQPPSRGARSGDRAGPARGRFRRQPFYAQPVFYVGVVAAIVCGYFAIYYH
jgi:hypothetical protein